MIIVDIFCQHLGFVAYILATWHTFYVELNEELCHDPHKVGSTLATCAINKRFIWISYSLSDCGLELGQTWKHMYKCKWVF